LVVAAAAASAVHSSQSPADCAACVRHRVHGRQSCGHWYRSAHGAVQGPNLERATCDCCRVQCGLPKGCNDRAEPVSTPALVAEGGAAALDFGPGALLLASAAELAAVGALVLRRALRTGASATAHVPLN
jgi:hypothetical protein